jgi:DNA-directed RNA polymerase subunit RPC12/RpoP
MNLASETPSPEKVRRYRCPGCSADLAFEPKDGCLTCPYCGRQEPIPASAAEVKERSYEEYLQQDRAQLQVLAGNAVEVQCAACGSSVTFAPPEVAGQCPFCSANIIAQPQSANPVVSPEGILPFKIPKPQAVLAIRNWLSSRWFAPNALLQMSRQEAISGVYLPFWTYDAHTISHYSGERGEYYWVTETYQDKDSQGRPVTKTRQVRRTRWYPAAGTVTRWFDDVLVAATTSLPLTRLEALQPWDLGGLLPYDPAYLAGQKAQRYQLGLREGFEQAKIPMQTVIRNDVRQDIGGDEQRIHQVTTSYSGITFKHLLLPVWVSAYRFNQKVFQVLVNARTGEVQGDRPYSVWKIAAFVVFLLIVLLTVIYLGRK